MAPISVTSWFLASVVIPVLVPLTGAHLVDSLVNKGVPIAVESDTLWGASVEGDHCYMDSNKTGGASPLSLLLTKLVNQELKACVPTVIFDPSLPMAGARDDIYAVLRDFPIPKLIGQLKEPSTPSWMPKPPAHRIARKHPGAWQAVVGLHDWKCRSYMVILDDVMKATDVIVNTARARVVIVTRSPLWRIRDFLSGPQARRTLNLLVVQDRNWKRVDSKQGFVDVNLMTHRVFGDSLGGSFPQILTSWRCDHLTRPWVRLFPTKMLEGFSGHQFKVAAVDSPPFVYKTTTADLESAWDGYEVRIMSLLAGVLNFTLDFREPVLESEDRSGILAATRVVREVLSGASEVGAGGVYITTDRLAVLDMPQQHTQDCASFMTLASVALPRYRAILGPFQWTVWLAVSLAYILAIIPLVFSHHLSLNILIRHPGQIENMFWYVFGTFTNSFQFKGEDTWVGSKRDSTRMIVGWYWAFSIIVTACYTGSVISFIAFPVFPALVENVKDVREGGYRVGTLNSGGWTEWFLNSSDPETDKLLKHVDLVPTVYEGIQNMTHASFFHPYSFLGSRLYLEHVVRTNYSAENKRSRVHIGKECFVPFWVSLIFPRDAVYGERLSHMILRALQSGLIEREKRNVRWDIQRSSTGALLQASSGTSLRIVPSEERMLTLDDTQGMFLLLAIGVGLALCALTAENVVGRVSVLRDRCPPGPRRKSSAGLNLLWLEGSRCSSAFFDPKEDRHRLKRPSHGGHRRSVNSLPGNMLNQDEKVAKVRSLSIATAPPIVFIDSTHSLDDLDEAACLQTSDESGAQIVKEGSRDVRSFSIFSWLSSLAAKFKRESQGHEQFLDSSSSSADSRYRDRDRIIYDSSEPDRLSSPTQTYTVDPNLDLDDVEKQERPHLNVESVFGSRQDVESISQQVTPLETDRLSSLELLKPLERMEEAEKNDDQTRGASEIGIEHPMPAIEQSTSVEQLTPVEQATSAIEQVTSAIEQATSVEQSTSNQGIEQPISVVPVPIETATGDIPVPRPVHEKETLSESERQSTKLHRRTPSTFSRTQTNTEPPKKSLRVPRTSSRSRPK